MKINHGNGVVHKIILIFLMSFFGAHTAFTKAIENAKTPEDKGLAIFKETDRRDHGYGDTVAKLEMVLTNRSGKKSRRSLKIKTFEMEDPKVGDKSLVVFDRPRDVKGTVFLTHSKILKPDDQWLFLPALTKKGRVKRISSKNKSGPFMGSEFSYEDMSAREVGKYSYKWLRDEPCDLGECYVVEAYPLYKRSGYKKQINWIDKKEFRIWKTEFYNRRGSLLKTLTMSDFRLYLKKYWRAHDLFMENKLTGKTTRLKWSRYEFRKGLREQDFSKARIKTVK